MVLARWRGIPTALYINDEDSGWTQRKERIITGIDKCKNPHHYYFELPLTGESAKGYTEVLVTDWNDVFFRAKGISQDIAFYSDEGQQLIADFAAAATTIDNYPDINMDLDILKQQIIRTSRILSYKTGTILEKLKGDAKSFDRNIAAPVIREFLKPLYAKCGQARGVF